MDREVLVGQIQKLRRQLSKEHGPVALLLLVSPDAAVDDEWNIVVSARGFNSMTRADGIRRLTTVLRRELGRNLWPKIKRATVLRTDDPFVVAMTTAFHTTRSVVDLLSCHVRGVEIPRGVLFTSKKVAA